MHATTRSLTLELRTWIARRPRTDLETMEAWRSSCPRHPVWDDALVDGLVRVENGTTMDEARVTIAPRGRQMLDREAQGEQGT